LKVPCEPFKQSFLNLNKVAIWDGHEAENEFRLTCDPLKHRFLELIKVEFWDGQEAENDI